MPTPSPHKPCPVQHSRGAAGLRVAGCRDDELVHLMPVADDVPAQESLCGRPLVKHAPRRLFHVGGCRNCVDVALELGVTFIQDRHGALINVGRFRQRQRP